MPVTVTAKRALRSSAKKSDQNRVTMSRLGIAFNKARKRPTEENIRSAVSLADRAAKKKVIHKNKASRIKSQLSRFTKSSKKSTK